MKTMFKCVARYTMAILLIVSAGGCTSADPYPAWAGSPEYHPGNRPAVFDYVPEPTHWRHDQDKMDAYRRAFGQY